MDTAVGMYAPMNDVTTSKRRRRKREIRPDIDRRTSAPFNGETAERMVADPYSTTGGKIVVTASLRDDPLGRADQRWAGLVHGLLTAHNPSPANAAPDQLAS
jgi:hypothetical protein